MTKFAAFILSFIATLSVVIVPMRLSELTETGAQVYQYDDEYEYHVVSGLQPEEGQDLRISDGWHRGKSSPVFDALDFVFPSGTNDQPVYADIRHVSGRILRAKFDDYEGLCTGKTLNVILDLNNFGEYVSAFEVDYVHIRPANEVMINGESVASWLLKPTLKPPEIGRTLENEKYDCEDQMLFSGPHLHQRVYRNTTDSVYRDTRIEKRGEVPFTSALDEFWNWRCVSPSHPFWKIERRNPAIRPSIPNPVPLAPPNNFVVTHQCRTLIVEVPSTGEIMAKPEAMLGYLQLSDSSSATSRYERIYHNHGGSALRDKGPPLGPLVEHRSLITLTASPPAGHVAKWSDTGKGGTVTASGIKYVVTMDSDRTVAVTFLYSAYPEHLLLSGESGILSASFTSSHWAEFEIYRKKNGSFCTPGARGCSPDGTASAAAGDSPVSFGEQPSGTYRARSQGCIAASTSSVSGSSGASGAGAVGGSSATSGSRLAASDECGDWSAWSPEFAHTAPTATATPAPTYRLTVRANPSSCGNVSGENDYAEGEKAPIGASVKANANCHFTGWTGTGIENASSSSTKVTMGATPKTVTANFTRQCKLTVKVTPSGGGTTTPAAGTHTYDPCPQSVSLSASPSTGYRFDKWSGDASGSSISTSVSIRAGDNKTVTANFVRTSCTLTVKVTPSGGGTTTPAAGSTHTYDPCKSSVNLSASPSTGYRFGSWSGAGIASTSSSSTTVAMSAGDDKTVTAHFVRKPPTSCKLTVKVTPSGGGTTTPAAGTHTYDPCPRSVSLSATPSSGYRFGSWSGAGIANASSSSTTVAMSAGDDKTVTARFARTSCTLTVRVSPSGGGTTTPAAGTHTYRPCPSSVSLKATPNSGYRFVRWYGASGTSASTSVALKDGDSKTVTARFAKQCRLTATSSPGGTVSGGGTFDCYTWKLLTATVTTGSSFARWTGDLSGSRNPGWIYLNTAKNVRAVFSCQVTVTAGAGGSVRGNGSPDCGARWTVRAVHNDYHYLKRWIGDSRTSSVLTLYPSGNTTLRAVFDHVCNHPVYGAFCPVAGAEDESGAEP